MLPRNWVALSPREQAAFETAGSRLSVPQAFGAKPILGLSYLPLDRRSVFRVL